MQRVAWFHRSDIPGSEFDVEAVVREPERLDVSNIEAVRDYYANRSRKRHEPALRSDLPHVVRNIFIALSQEQRHVFVREVDHQHMSVPIRGDMPIDDVRPYLTDGRNLRGYDAALFRELEGLGRPFLTLQSARVLMWLELPSSSSSSS